MMEDKEISQKVYKHGSKIEEAAIIQETQF